MSSTSSKIIRTIAIFVIVFVLLGLGAWYVMEHGLKGLTFSTTKGYIIEPLTGAYQEKSSYKVESKKINEIQIDWICSSVEIKVFEKDDISLVESCQRDLKPGEALSYTIEEGILKIVFLEDETLRRIPPKELIVWLPKDIATNLNTLKIDSDLSTVTVSAINADIIYIESDIGSISAKNLTASESITLRTDISNIEAKDLKASNIVIESDTGRITTKNLSATEKIDLDTDTGRIIVNEVSTDSLVCTSETGRIECDTFTVNSLSLKSDVGSIETKGNFKSGNFRTSTGSITIKSNSLPDKIDARSDTGSITLYVVKTDKLTVSYNTDLGRFNTDFPILVSSSGDAPIKLKTSTGSIYIKEYEAK